jgi:ribonuclease VapC
VSSSSEHAGWITRDEEEVHLAGLNFGDCFSYEVAKEHFCPLLYVGEHFAKTDLESAL